MNRALAAIALLPLFGCSNEPRYVVYQTGQLELSADLFDFGEIESGDNSKQTLTLFNPGELSVGISSVELATDNNPDRGHGGSFALSWRCDDQSFDPDFGEDAGRDQPGTDTAHDTSEDTDPVDTADTADPDDPTGVCALKGGYSLDVDLTFSPSVGGDNYDAVLVKTAAVDLEAGQETTQGTYRDPDHAWRMAVLHGTSPIERGQILVRPDNADYRWVWPTQEESRHFTVKHLGGANSVLTGVSLEDCDDGYELVVAPESNATITSTVPRHIEVEFAPQSEEPARCELLITTDHPEEPEFRIDLQANTRSYPDFGDGTIDQDGDGRSEVDGDCDDDDIATYKGATELPDGVDNDCDEVVDEHTNSFDDDSDGFTEDEGDCDDGDPTLAPSLVEVCDDGRDNDCDGLTDGDDACISAASAPMVIGRLNLSRTDIFTNESVTASVQTYDEDGEALDIAWQVRDDAGELSATSGEEVIWTAPSSLPPGSGYANPWRVTATVTDGSGNEVQVSQDITVHLTSDVDMESELLVRLRGEESRAGCCGRGAESGDTAAAGGVAAFLVALVTAFRRRRDP